MIIIANRMGLPTSFAARMETSSLLSPGCGSPSRRVMFSVITIPASTMTPMAMAIPAIDIMFEGSPMNFMPRKENRIPSGRIRDMIMLLVNCPRNTRITIEATIIWLIRVSFSVSVALLISAVRS